MYTYYGVRIHSPIGCTHSSLTFSLTCVSLHSQWLKWKVFFSPVCLCVWLTSVKICLPMWMNDDDDDGAHLKYLWGNDFNKSILHTRFPLYPRYILLSFFFSFSSYFRAFLNTFGQCNGTQSYFMHRNNLMNSPLSIQLYNLQLYGDFFVIFCGSAPTTQ